MTSPEDLRIIHADLIEHAEDIAQSLTELLVPEDLQRLGFRFVLDTTPLSVLSEKGTDRGEPRTD
jgi:hypothetical protein